MELSGELSKDAFIIYFGGTQESKKLFLIKMILINYADIYLEV